MSIALSDMYGSHFGGASSVSQTRTLGLCADGFSRMWLNTILTLQLFVELLLEEALATSSWSRLRQSQTLEPSDRGLDQAPAMTRGRSCSEAQVEV